MAVFFCLYFDKMIFSNIIKYKNNGGVFMFELYAELSKAADVFNSVRNEEEHLEYYEVLDMIEDRYNEKEIMGLIIKLYSQSH